jgi:hypothetical protein
MVVLNEVHPWTHLRQRRQVKEIVLRACLRRTVRAKRPIENFKPAVAVISTESGNSLWAFVRITSIDGLIQISMLHLFRPIFRAVVDQLDLLDVLLRWLLWTLIKCSNRPLCDGVLWTE